MIVNPWGGIMAEAGSGEEIIVATYDPAYLNKIRWEMPCLSIDDRIFINCSIHISVKI